MHHEQNILSKMLGHQLLDHRKGALAKLLVVFSVAITPLRRVVHEVGVGVRIILRNLGPALPFPTAHIDLFKLFDGGEVQ